MSRRSISRLSNAANSTTAQQLANDMVNRLIQHVDKSGRQLSELFLTLPDKSMYPDYYTIIKQPKAFDEIQNNIQYLKYATFGKFVEDIDLMFKNAKIYNRQGSLVYKDSTVLQTLFHERLNTTLQEHGLELSSPFGDGEYVEPLPFDEYKAILKKLGSIKGAEGHFIADLFLELPSAKLYPDYYTIIKQPISLKEIKKKVSSKEYKTVEEFEKDINLMVRNAQTYNEPSSFVVADALELQSHFRRLLGKEEPAEDQQGVPAANVTEVPNIVNQGKTYQVGDFVYIHNPQNTQKPTIGQIFSTWTQNSGEKKAGFTACWYLRPEQTTRRVNQKFYDNEVIKSFTFEHYLANDIVGRCIVIPVKDYVRGNPKGFDRQDVFICETRYSEHTKQHQKIKNWTLCLPQAVRSKEVELDLFDRPLTIARTFVPEEVPTPLVLKKRKAVEDPEMEARKLQGTGQGIYGAAATPVPSGQRVTRQYAKGATGYANTTGGFPPSSASASRDPLPKSIVEKFDTTDDGQLKWFAAPPLQVVPEQTTVHSIEYLNWKSQQTKDEVMDSPPALTHLDDESQFHIVFDETQSIPGYQPGKEEWAPVTNVLHILADYWLQEANKFSVSV